MTSSLTTAAKAGVVLLASAVLGLAGFTGWHLLQPAPVSAPADAATPVVAATYEQVRALEAAAQTGGDALTLTQLGLAYLQSARETGDGVYVDRAETAFQRALEQTPEQAEALSGLGVVWLTRHRFGAALTWGERALAANPHRAATYGILVDAHLELGAYDEAVAAAQQMVDLRPDLASYTRVSYLRELHGDLDGAIDAMQRATTAASGTLEHTLWSHVYLGHLYLRQGRVEAAEAQYQTALALLPRYGHALAGLGRIATARGETAEAVRHYEAAVAVFPIPEYVIALGDAYAADGRTQDAAVRHEEALTTLEDERLGGMDVDEELAMLLLDHDRDVPRALLLAEGAFERRPTVKNASILAWAHHKNGQSREALAFARQSLRMGTADAGFYYRAGTIALAAGATDEARRWLQRAFDLNLAAEPDLARHAHAQLATR